MCRSTERAGGPSPVPGPPGFVARVVDAVHGLPGRPAPGVQAEALARGLGECLHAATVTIALWLPLPAGHDADAAAGHTVQEYRWTATGADAAVPGTGTAPVRLYDGEQILADLAIEPPAAAERLG